MPIHDWTRVHAGVWHDFFVGWLAEIRRGLNRGGLPDTHYASIQPGETEGGPDEVGEYARKRRTVSVCKGDDDAVVAIIEIVSPGTRATRVAFESFVRKTTDALTRGIHLLLIDLFPSTPRDPMGVHHAIWANMVGGAGEGVVPSVVPLTLVSYSAGKELTAYVESVSVGESAPDMPLFLTHDSHVAVPLEATYSAAFEGVPAKYKRILT